MKLYPEIILRANTSNKNVGAFKFWVLAKDYDRGSGFLPAKAFRRYLFKDLKIPRATVYRWLAAAQEYGLIDYQNEIYRLVSWDKGAAIAGVDRLIRPVTIPKEDFIKKGWLSTIWKMFVSYHYSEKIIARSTLKQLTGVPERTQFEYEVKAGVKKTACMADWGDPAKDPENARAKDPGVFGMSNGHTGERLPDRYNKPKNQEGYGLAAKGSTKQRNDKLKELRTEGSINESYQRRYCETKEQQSQARKQNIKANIMTRINELFLFRGLSGSKSRMYAASPL